MASGQGGSVPERSEDPRVGEAFLEKSLIGASSLLRESKMFIAEYLIIPLREERNVNQTNIALRWSARH